MNEWDALAWAVHELPLSSLHERTGVSKSTWQRLRRCLERPIGQNVVSKYSEGSQGVVSGSNSTEVAPSSLEIPPVPKGTSPQGKSNSRKPKPVKVSCPEDFQPSEKELALAEELGVNPVDARNKMVDWSLSDLVKNRRSDWNATFRNWLRREAEMAEDKRKMAAERDKRYARPPGQLEHEQAGRAGAGAYKLFPPIGRTMK